jgi:hypothetical protein
MTGSKVVRDPVDRDRSPDDGGEGDRTPDLVNAIHALSQLSYAPGTDRKTGPFRKRKA